MKSDLAISDYLNEVHTDWLESRESFPKNVYLKHYWPIPFFGNPATALVATVGVNPSSGEFAQGRKWKDVQSAKDWKLRLKNYFKGEVPAHRWFGTWSAGLDLLGVSYAAGTAAHVDVSYRPTKAMLRNRTTDHAEFRHMIDRDVAWLFQLLPLCPNLRGLLVFGPVVRSDGTTESLAAFFRNNASRHGVKVSPDNGVCREVNGQPDWNFFIHEVTALETEDVTDTVLENLTQHRQILLGKLHLKSK